MHFMVLVKATADSEAEVFRPEQMRAMGTFNERLANDGVLLAAEGLHPTSRAVRLRFDEGRTTVIDGPFAETKELVAGFWLVSSASKREVVERFMRAPFDRGQELEIRQFYDLDDVAHLLTPERREMMERVTLHDLGRSRADAP